MPRQNLNLEGDDGSQCNFGEKAMGVAVIAFGHPSEVLFTEVTRSAPLRIAFQGRD